MDVRIKQILDKVKVSKVSLIFLCLISKFDSCFFANSLKCSNKHAMPFICLFTSICFYI